MKIIIFIVVICTLFVVWSLCVVGASADEQLEMIYAKDLERKENSMDNTYAPTENKEQEKIKVESIDIVVTGAKEKPYYAIKYRKIGNNEDRIGYGSYTLGYVLGWKEQCFELLERKSEWIPIGERLPEAGEYILVSFANEGFSLPDIAVYEVDSYGNGVFYPADKTVPYSLIGVFVNAWMPLPEPYKEKTE